MSSEIVVRNQKTGVTKMEKSIAVVAGDKIHDVVIRPGTTVKELLTQLGLPAKLDVAKKDGLFLGSNEIVWDGVENGDKLHVVPPARVAR